MRTYIHPGHAVERKVREMGLKTDCDAGVRLQRERFWRGGETDRGVRGAWDRSIRRLKKKCIIFFNVQI